MMRVLSFRIAVAASLLCLPAVTRLAAQTGTIEGKVTSVTTGEPIVGAEVSLVGITIGTRTGLGGTFTLLNVPAGQRELRVLAIGFKVATAQLVVLPDQTTTTTATGTQCAAARCDHRDRHARAGARARGGQLDRAGQPVAGQGSASEHGSAVAGAGTRAERDANERHGRRGCADPPAGRGERQPE